MSVYSGVRNPHSQESLPLSPERRLQRLDDALKTLKQMFPNICPKEATALLQITLISCSTEQALQLTVEHCLLHGFSKSSNAHGASASDPVVVQDSVPEFLAEREFVDLSSSSSDDSVSEDGGEDVQCYREWCIYRLCVDFPRVALLSLRTALRLYRGELGPTYKAVYFQHQRAAKEKGIEFIDLGIVAGDGCQDASWLPRGKLKLLKCDRPPRSAPIKKCPRFEREWETLQMEIGEIWEGALNRDGVLDGGGEASPDVLIECGCCCSESLFEDLVQCADGHLFCAECLRRHLETYIFGGTKTCSLPTCMDTNGCDKTFPWSEVRRALSNDVLFKYEQRQAEDAVARAKLEGLVYCPFCNHPWEVDRGMTVLHCLNHTCRKASCIKCKEPNHQPLCCEDVEKKSETSLRRKVEELMSKALIRECSSCRAELVKTEGCNKITCRCGQNMCYVCRVPITDYSHFCQHAREPGKSCNYCSGCSLWELENEAEVVRAAKQAAIDEVGAQEPGFLKRDIGPSEEGKEPKRSRLSSDVRAW